MASKFFLNTIIGTATLEKDIEEYGKAFGDVKKDGHAILVSCIYHGMPENLETGADGKSLKNPGNGSYLNRFLEIVNETHPQYIPRLKMFVKKYAPFEVEGDKVKFKEARFRAMGGDRRRIVDDIHALTGTWYDVTKDKKEKERPDVTKKLVNLIKSISAMENLTATEKAILDGLKAVAAHAKVELPESK